MRSYDKKDIKVLNRLSVFSFVKNQPGQTVSRPQVAKALGITDPTVLKITAFFEERGILREVGEADVTTVGRKPNLLSFVPNAALSIGMDYDGSRFSVAVVDLNENTVSFQSQALSVPLEELFDQVIPPAVFQLGLPREKCLGLGLSLPAAVNTKTGVIEMRNPVIDLGNKTDFSDNIRKLARNIGMPVFLENDVNAAATAHLKSLQDGHYQDFIYIVLGLGLGAGIVIDQKLRRGARFSAGEIGYMTMDWDFEARPDQSGWLERQLNRQTIRERFGFDVLNGAGGDAPPQVIDHVARHVDFVIANLSAALDIDTFVLGGVVTENLGQALIERAKEMCGSMCVRPIHILPETAPDVIARGMGAVVNDEMLNRFLSDHFALTPDSK